MNVLYSNWFNICKEKYIKSQSVIFFTYNSFLVNCFSLFSNNAYRRVNPIIKNLFLASYSRGTLV